MRSQHHFDRNLGMKCFFAECNCVLNSAESVRLHVLHTHKAEWDAAGRRQHCRNRIDQGEPNLHTEGEIAFLNELVTVDNEHIGPSSSQLAVSNFNKMMDNVRKQIPALYMRMKYKYGIPRRVARNLHQDYVDVLRYVRNKWSSSLRQYTSGDEYPNDVDLKIIMMCGELDQICQTSTHKERAQLRSLGYIEPIEIDLKKEAEGIAAACNPLNDAEPDEEDIEALIIEEECED